MITLLLLYVLPALFAILTWVTVGWKLSLSAAPDAYRRAAIDNEDNGAYMAERSRKLTEIDAKITHMRSCGCHSSTQLETYRTKKDQILKDHMEKWKKNSSPEAVAKAVGKKCLKRGPFAYFLTPAWNTKVECNWYPVEVNVKKIQDGADKTLMSLKEINGPTLAECKDYFEKDRIGAII